MQIKRTSLSSGPDVYSRMNTLFRTCAVHHVSAQRRRQVVCVYRRRFLSLHRRLASFELLCNSALETETQEQSGGFRQAIGSEGRETAPAMNAG